MLDQQRSRAAGAVARDLSLAAVGIEQVNGSVALAAALFHEHPAVRAHAGAAFANGARDFGRGSGDRLLPGEEEVIMCAVRFSERDFHAAKISGKSPP